VSNIKHTQTQDRVA